MTTTRETTLPTVGISQKLRNKQERSQALHLNIPWHTVHDRPLITLDSMINLNTNPFWIGIKLHCVEEGFIRIHLIKTQLEQSCTALCTADLSVLTINCQTSKITSEWLKSTNCNLWMPVFSQSEIYGLVCCSLETTIFRQNIFWVAIISKPSYRWSCWQIMSMDVVRSHLLIYVSLAAGSQ